MKDKSSVGGFLHFMLCEEAIYQGWDFEGNAMEFLAGKLEKGFPVYTLKSPNKDILTFEDCLCIIKSDVYTDNAMTFFKELGKLVPDNAEGSDVIFMSMHNGGSDYFTVSMLQSILAS